MNSTAFSLTDQRLVVTGSGGLVARRAERVLVIPDLPPTSGAHVAELVGLCLDDQLSDSDVILRRAAYLLTDPAVHLPGFCLLVGTPDRHARLFLHGAVQVSVPSDVCTLSAADQSTWIERQILDPAGLQITAAGVAADQTDWTPPWLDLRDGVVVGSAAMVTAPGSPSEHSDSMNGTAQPHEMPLAPEPVVPAAAEPHHSKHVHVVAEAPTAPPAAADHPTARRQAVPRPVSFEAVLLPVAASAPAHAPLPMADEPEEETGQVFVQGVICSRGHFNDPNAAYCTGCGISMVQRTHEYVSGRRPPLGVLLFEDGSAFTVDGNYVLGREPDFDPAVTSGSARPLTLADPENAISRVHAELWLDGWRVLLVDRHSANGTCIAGVDSDDWTPLEPGQPVELAPRQRIRFGGHSAVYDSNVRQR